MELQIKDIVVQALSNPILVGLIRDKKYAPDAHTQITLDGNLKFEISLESDNIVIRLDDFKPKISYSPLSNMKRLFKLDGRLSTITITPSKIVLGIDGLPDQTINLI